MFVSACKSFNCLKLNKNITVNCRQSAAENRNFIIRCSIIHGGVHQTSSLTALLITQVQFVQTIQRRYELSRAYFTNLQISYINCYFNYQDAFI